MATRKTGCLDNLFAKFLLQQEINEVGIFCKGKSLEKHIIEVEKKLKELSIQQDKKFDFLVKTLQEDVFLEIQSRQDFQEDYDYVIKQLQHIHGDSKTSISRCSSVLEIKQRPGQKMKDFVSEIRINVMKLFPHENKE